MTAQNPSSRGGDPAYETAAHRPRRDDAAPVSRPLPSSRRRASPSATSAPVPYTGDRSALPTAQARVEKNCIAPAMNSAQDYIIAPKVLFASDACKDSGEHRPATSYDRPRVQPGLTGMRAIVLTLARGGAGGPLQQRKRPALFHGTPPLPRKGEPPAIVPIEARQNEDRGRFSAPVHRSEPFALVVLALDGAAVPDEGVKHDGGV